MTNFCISTLKLENNESENQLNDRRKEAALANFASLIMMANDASPDMDPNMEMSHNAPHPLEMTSRQ
jgi:hypothetical protein